MRKYSLSQACQEYTDKISQFLTNSICEKLETEDRKKLLKRFWVKIHQKVK